MNILIHLVILCALLPSIGEASGRLPKQKAQTAATQVGIWTTVQGNPEHTGFMDVHLNPKKFQKRWTQTFTEGAARVSSPVITTDSCLYFVVTTYKGMGAYSLITALHPTSGNTVWSTKIPYGAVITYSDNQIFAQVGSDLYTFQADSGAFINIYGLQSSSIYASQGPIALDGVIYTTAADSISSRYAAKGYIKWLGEPLESHPSGLPAIHEPYIIEAVTGGIDVYDTSYGILDFSISSPDLLGLSSSTQAPVFDVQNEAVYACFLDDNVNTQLVAFDLKNQTIKWMLPNHIGQVALGNNELYVRGDRDDNKLYAIDPLTSNINWSWTPEPNDGKIAMLYGSIVTPNLIFVPGEKKTFAISRTTHKKIWEFPEGGLLATDNNMLLICNKDAPDLSSRITAILLR